MKIVAIGPVPPLRGGISHYNASLIQELRTGGHEVTAFSYRRLYPPLLFPGTTEVDPGSKLLEGASALLLAWDPRTWVAVRDRIRTIAPDRLVIHHWHPFFVPALRFITASLPKSRVDIIAHNVLPHEHGLLGKLLNPLLLRHASRVYVGARSEAKLLKRLAPSVEAAFTPHPVYDRFSGAERLDHQVEAKRELGYSPEQILFMHLGLVRPYKGVDILLEAFANLPQPELRLEIAGEFYEDVSLYQRKLRELNLTSRVKLVNRYLPDEELTLRLRAADAVVLPYRHATQSGVAMAALAAGVPVVASRVGALADIVEEGVFGCLAEPGSRNDLSRALLQFLRIGVDRWRLGRSEIAKTVRQRYTWHALAARIVREGE